MRTPAPFHSYSFISTQAQSCFAQLYPRKAPLQCPALSGRTDCALDPQVVLKDI